MKLLGGLLRALGGSWSALKRLLEAAGGVLEACWRRLEGSGRPSGGDLGEGDTLEESVSNTLTACNTQTSMGRRTTDYYYYYCVVWKETAI